MSKDTTPAVVDFVRQNVAHEREAAEKAPTGHLAAWVSGALHDHLVTHGSDRVLRQCAAIEELLHKYDGLSHPERLIDKILFPSLRVAYLDALEILAGQWGWES